MDRAGVLAWVEEYVRGWRECDPSSVARLFTEDAVYRRSPYQPPDLGHAGIGAFWLEDEGQPFETDHEVVAVEADRALVRVRVLYHRRPADQEYQDLWVLRFAADGRAAEFEEWPFWPGAPYTVSGEPSLRVEVFPRDLERSVAFYTDVLRFGVVVDRRPSEAYVFLRRGTVFVGAVGRPEAPETERRPPAGVELVLEVDDVVAERELVAATGWPLDADLARQHWGLTDFRVLDPDGYYWRITGRG